MATFSEIADAAFTSILHDGGSPQTVRVYDIAAKMFVQHLRNCGLNDDFRKFTTEHVQSFKEALGRGGANPNTIRQKLSALRAVATYAMGKTERGKPLLAFDPTRTVRWPQPQESDITILTPAELRAFLAVELSPRQRLARDLVLDTGLRSAEICRANMEHLVEAPEGVYLRVTVKGRGRRQRHRDVPLSPHVAQQVHDVRTLGDQAGLQDPVLVTDAGYRHDMHSLYALMASIAKRAGLLRFARTWTDNKGIRRTSFRVGPHKMRHLVSTMMKRGGVDPFTRAKAMNQSSVKTQQHYDHVTPEELFQARQAAQDALQRYLGAASAPAASKVDPETTARALDLLSRLPAEERRTVLDRLQDHVDAVNRDGESGSVRDIGTGHEHQI